jgi:hypothetical protein
MLMLSDLRLDPRDEDDLIWFFTEAEGEMGVRSNHEPILFLILTGIPQGVMHATDLGGRALLAAERVHDIGKVLAGVGGSDLGVLRLRYGAGLNEDVEGVFGPESPLLVCSVALRAAHKQSGTKRAIGDWTSLLVRRVHKGTCGDADRQVVRAVRAECEAMVIDAHRAYRAARKLCAA